MVLHEEIVEVLEANGFYDSYADEHDGKFYVELEQWTPAGEDWLPTIWYDGSSKDFVNSVREYACDFDVDDEVSIWIELRGRHGVPSSIRVLLEDAEWKKQKLEDLAEKLMDLDL